MKLYIADCWGDNPNEPGSYETNIRANSAEEARKKLEDYGANVLSVRESSEQDVCPKCGKKLKLRVNRYGHPFMGCVGYPNCKYCENA